MLSSQDFLCDLQSEGSLTAPRSSSFLSFNSMLKGILSHTVSHPQNSLYVSDSHVARSGQFAYGVWTYRFWSHRIHAYIYNRLTGTQMSCQHGPAALTRRSPFLFLFHPFLLCVNLINGRTPCLLTSANPASFPHLVSHQNGSKG